jgi:hypothetical protein
MTATFRYVLWICLIAISSVCTAAFSDDPPKKDESGGTAAVGEVSPQAAGAAAAAPDSSRPSTPTAQYAALLKDATQHSGMLNLWQKGNNLFAELSSGDYNSEFIVLISISRGISVGDLIGGYSWNMGDDWLWTFRKVDDRVHVVRTNVRFKANPGYPEAVAVQNAYTDSVLFSLPIVTKGPKGGDLVNLSAVFMSDLPQISQRMPGFMFSSDRSVWASVKAFPRNVELEVAATYASSGRMEIETVPDSRGATINVHYSISKLPATGYQPRLADDRVGYFLTVVKDFNKQSDRDQFVRYINRWHLEAPPGISQPPYPPKKAITFYIEKTVPHRYRGAVRAGIEEWNKAFEKAGWINAIEVNQQRDDETWDPEDINYNTFRWITANAGFAMGPSRVNPRTGQILDADIIFDADFLTYWKQEFETLTPQVAMQMQGRAPLVAMDRDNPAENVFRLAPSHPDCRLSTGMASQLAFGSASLFAAAADPKVAAAEQEKLIMQGLKEVVMHEVGHTLGLRHNFKASKLHNLKDLNDPEKIKDGAITASVMDYNPTNIVPKGWTQGNYYASTIGPYDHWAIEYGYKPLSGGTTGEAAELSKIAARSGEPALAYSTDEDTYGSDPDPDSNTWDLGGDAVEYAKQRAQIVQDVMPTLLSRLTKDGDDYTQVRRAFGVLLGEYGNAMYYVARNIGGLSTSRSHKGDKDAKPPISPVAAERQRAAIAMLEEHVFSHKPYEFPPELYNYLATTRWSHWGIRSDSRKDYPIHDVILRWQSQVLNHLLSPVTLERIHDTELKVSADADVLTTAELIERLTRSIFSELDSVKDGEFTNRKPAINSLRRNLQREYLRRLSVLAMGNSGSSITLLGFSIGSAAAPDDCQTVAFAELAALEARMSQLLKSNVKLDSYSRAHLMESSSRIAKVLDARLTLRGP